MVKKFIFNLKGDYVIDTNSYNTQKKRELFKINDMIHQQLINQKNSITHHHKSRKWDKFKKLTNDYELVFTSTQGYPSIADYYPISRSYFKLWEILNDFADEINFPDKPITAIFLADAPGGFGEAFLNFRDRNFDDNLEQQDKLYAMSLKATNKIIPNWKFNDAYCKKHNITLFYGTSGTGNLYDLSNINDLTCETNGNSCHFITADGGFDFSSDFNNQEEMSFRLILCEVYSALRLQSQGGCFVLKIYDIHSLTTMKLLYILKLFYENIYFIKPLSSRPANSEKYVLCTNFSFENKKILYNDVLKMLKQNILTYTQYNTNTICNDISIPIQFIRDIVDYNRIYITNQTIHIMKTLSLIDNTDNTNNNIIDATDTIKHQVRKAVKWCYKYNINISLNNLQRYRQYYQDLPIGGPVPAMASSPTTGLT
jgi:23S rRNA U2552 (ribose-2'-O)-methylase RlmE/FtsJ